MFIKEILEFRKMKREKRKVTWIISLFLYISFYCAPIHSFLFVYICICFLSCISHSIIVETQCFIMVLSVKMSKSILYPEHVFLFYLKFIFSLSFTYHNGKLKFPRTLVICPESRLFLNGLRWCIGI